jgi:hypothetical protein
MITGPACACTAFCTAPAIDSGATVVRSTIVTAASPRSSIGR